MKILSHNRLAPTWKRSHPPALGWICALLISCFQPGAASAAIVEGITFAEVPGKLYLPAGEVGSMLNWTFRWDKRTERVVFNGRSIPPTAVRRLVDGTQLVSINDLEAAGAVVLPDVDGSAVRISSNGNEFTIRPGDKWVEISLPAQDLKAWQGGRLVLSSRISSGRRGSTPGGDFQTGPYKARMHYSSIYDNAPMPWSVQINGHVFIHGFSSVPRYPASHGCIRLPLDEGNPAKFFYEWSDHGTPVRVMAK